VRWMVRPGETRPVEHAGRPRSEFTVNDRSEYIDYERAIAVQVASTDRASGIQSTKPS